MESLIDLLAKTIRKTDNQVERLNAVFCLSLMSYKEESSL
jgi:hypothetical protein